MTAIKKLEATVPKLMERKKVAAYARVSMESDNLLHSLAAQVSYYENLIKGNPEWEYAGVFADSGITGTAIKNRSEFNRLMEECENGKVDIVLVKSISRFARNTVDTLSAIRHLKEIGVEVRFERENISTFSGDGELLVTILASYAQEESRSISQNVKWATRKRFEQGIPNGYKAPFGYFWNGEKYKKIPEQADTVKLIFKLYLDGWTPFQIRDELKNRGIKGQSGADMTDCTIRYILSNVSYTGLMILQKNYINESHERKINKGELARYAVEDMYDRIITDEDFEKAQKIKATRAELYAAREDKTRFSGKVRCGKCSSKMSRRLKKKWVCNRKERKSECSSKGISEEDLIKLTKDIKYFEEIVVFDDRIEICLFNKKKLIKKRSYKGKRRGGFSGRIYCGCCGSPVYKDGNVRKCSHCSIKIKEDELFRASKDVLDTADPEPAFAERVNRMIVYPDKLEFNTKEGDVRWQRK